VTYGPLPANAGFTNTGENMTKYQVTIEAVIRKTYEVEAEDMQKAQEMANEMFTVEPDGDEYYDQQAIDVEEC
jgi:hypothetical protein